MSSLTLILSTNNSRDNNSLKNLTPIATLTGDLRSQSSIIDPVIRVEYSNNLAPCNYMQIPEFGRAYFVKDIIAVRKNLWEIHAHCDVLSTASALGLNNCKAIVRRQENAWNLYLDDGVFKAYSNPRVVQKSFPSGFNVNNSSYILAVAGS